MSLFNFLKKKDHSKYSQSGQDKFAYNLSGRKGFYLEIGASHPLNDSNTYRLEIDCEWKGLSVEQNTHFRQFWDKYPERLNEIIWKDAFDIDYEALVRENKIPKKIDYLSCDIEPPENTFNILKKIINQNLKFNFISFEHDKYKIGNKYEVLSEEFLLNKNYKVAIRNVYSRSKKYKVYETWFVHKRISFDEISYKTWLDKNYKNNNF